MINPDYSNPRRKARIEREEKELEELMKASQKPQEPDEEEEDQEEPEVQEVEPKKEVKPKEETEEKEEELNSEEKTFKKRYGDLRRHSQKVEQELRNEIEKLKNKNPEVVPPTSEEELTDWMKKYPQVASIVSTIADKKAKEMFSSAEERLAKIDELTAEANRKSAEAKILESHSDFLSIRDSDDFHNWAEEQPKWVQDALYENDDDARSVIRVLDLYKVDMGLTVKDKKKAQKEAASSVRGKPSEPDVDTVNRKIRESVVAKMSDKEYEANEEKILEAMKTGNFIYDVTGGAR
jgi:hypothetical protein